MDRRRVGLRHVQMHATFVQHRARRPELPGMGVFGGLCTSNDHLDFLPPNQSRINVLPKSGGRQPQRLRVK